MKSYNVSEWMTNLEASIEQLEKAQTSDEKFKAAQALVNSIRFMR